MLLHIQFNTTFILVLTGEKNARFCEACSELKESLY